MKLPYAVYSTVICPDIWKSSCVEPLSERCNQQIGASQRGRATDRIRCGTQDRGSELLQHVAGVLSSQGVTCQQLAPTSDGLYFVDLALPGVL